MKKLIALAVFLSLFVAGTAAAEGSKLSYSHVAVSYFDGDVQLSGEARYHFSAPVSVGAKYRNSDDFDYWGVDLRYDF